MYPNQLRKNTNSEPKIKETYKITDFGGKSGYDKEAIQSRIKERIEKYSKDCERNFERAKENRKWASNNFGSQDDLTTLSGETAIYVPKIRENLETVIPMVTQKSPEPEIVVTAREGIGKQSQLTNISNSMSKYLKTFWEFEEYMQKRMEQGLRNYYCQAFFALKYYQDEETGKPCAYSMPMGNLIFPLRELRSTDDLPFIAEKVNDSWSNIRRKFFMIEQPVYDEMGNEVIDENGQPLMESVEDKSKIQQFIKTTSQYGLKELKDDTSIDYIEYWEVSLVAWQYKDFLLDVQPNPYYNFDGVNHFELPKIPYIIENCYSYGDKIEDDATAIETTRTLAQNINRTKRQLDLNQDDANGQLVINGDLISDEDVDKLDRSRQNKVVVKSQDGQSANVGNAIAYVSSRGMGAEAINNMAHSENHIDNEFGIHGVSRGEAQQMSQTATGQQVLKNSDQEKNSPLTRMIERVAQKTMNGVIQLLYVYGDKEIENAPQNADSSTGENLTKENLWKYRFKVQVKDGSTVPRNPAVMKAEIVDLASKGMASLIDMYRDLGYDDPEGRAKRAYAEKNPEMAMQLYGFDGNLDRFNVEAVNHIFGIIDGTLSPDDIYQIEDVKLYKAHMQTHTDYMAGKEIDPDLPSFMDLDEETQANISIHVDKELQMLQQLQALQTQQAVMANGMQGQQTMTSETADQMPQDQGNQPQVSQLTGNTEGVPLEASPEQAAVVAPAQ